MKLPPSWKVVICLLVVALSSGWIGAMLALRWQQDRTQQDNSSFGQFGAAYLDHLERYLQLTPEQKTKITPVLQRTREQIHSRTEEIVARAAQIRQQMNNELQPFLTPQQCERLAQLEQILERSRENARQRGSASERISPQQRERLRDQWQEHPTTPNSNTSR